MPLILAFGAMLALLHPSAAQARCLSHFLPSTGDARLHCAPEPWDRGAAYGPLRAHLAFGAPDARRRAEAAPPALSPPALSPPILSPQDCASGSGPQPPEALGA